MAPHGLDTAKGQRSVPSVNAHRLLREAYLYGSTYVFAHRRRTAYLAGDYSDTGWWYYFLYFLFVKTPPSLFGLLSISFLTAFPKSIDIGTIEDGSPGVSGHNSTDVC